MHSGLQESDVIVNHEALMRVAHSAAPVAWEYLARNSSPPGVTAGPVPGMRMPESTVPGALKNLALVM